MYYAHSRLQGYRPGVFDLAYDQYSHVSVPKFDLNLMSQNSQHSVRKVSDTPGFSAKKRSSFTPLPVDYARNPVLTPADSSTGGNVFHSRNGLDDIFDAIDGDGPMAGSNEQNVQNSPNQPNSLRQPSSSLA